MTLWGGRFSEDPDEIAWRYTASDTDRRLLSDDVEGSLAHVSMLVHVGLLSPAEHDELRRGLIEILADARDGTFEFRETDEDVHTAVERRLVELVGEVGKKLHTGRSRNDQIALDLRLYIRRSAAARADQLAAFGLTLTEIALQHAEVVIPSYTHLQQAQAVTLGHHLLAYAWMAHRDRGRFADLARRVSVSPLGAGASGGSSLPLDPMAAAQELGFDAVFANSMDAVASRDLVAEHIWCCAQTMVDLSRLAEEMVLWATSEFGWVTFSDAFTTGSSALPHKKNPDVAELARGKSARSIAALTGILALQKSLPLTYNRDLQEDKEYLFSADDTLEGTLEALTSMAEAATFHPPPPSSWVTALDLAEALVLRGVPFRDAHQSVGRLVASLLADDRDLGQATTGDLQAADPRFTPDDLRLLDPAASIHHRQTLGGGSPASVREQARMLRSLFEAPAGGYGR